MTKSEHFWHILHLHEFYSRADSNTAHMVHSDDVYFDKSGEKLSGEILGHARWAKIGLWNDDGTYSAAALLQWPKVSIFGIFCTYMSSIQERILIQRIWYIRMMFILINLVKNSAVKSSVTRGERRSGSETMMGHTLQQLPCNDQKWAFLAYFAPTQPFFLCPLRIFALERHACRCHQFGIVKVL